MGMWGRNFNWYRILDTPRAHPHSQRGGRNWQLPVIWHWNYVRMAEDIAPICLEAIVKSWGTSDWSNFWTLAFTVGDPIPLPFKWGQTVADRAKLCIERYWQDMDGLFDLQNLTLGLWPLTLQKIIYHAMHAIVANTPSLDSHYVYLLENLSDASATFVPLVSVFCGFLVVNLWALGDIISGVDWKAAFPLVKNIKITSFCDGEKMNKMC